jgi:hypothetical protein
MSKFEVTQIKSTTKYNNMLAIGEVLKNTNEYLFDELVSNNCKLSKNELTIEEVAEKVQYTIFNHEKSGLYDFQAEIQGRGIKKNEVIVVARIDRVLRPVE